MKLSVVIPAYNDLGATLTCLNSLRALKAGDVEFIVQDDDSPLVFFPAVIPDEIADVQRNARNLGFAANCNNGAARAVGDVLFFVNQDVFGAHGWSGGWDLALLQAFANPQVGISAPRLLFPAGGIQSAGGIFDQLRQPIHRCLGWANVHHPEVATPREVDWATGAALAFRRETWQQIGGFDTHYRMYWEDVDACLRAREAGWKIAYQPACTLVHSVGSTGGSPHFLDGAMRFKRTWVDSGKVTAGMAMPTARFW